MSLVYLLLMIVVAVFVLCGLCGCIRFLLDVRKFSAYKAELDSLQQKYIDKLQTLENDLIKESEEDEST